MMPQRNRPKPIPSYETLDERINNSMKPFSAKTTNQTEQLRDIGGNVYTLEGPCPFDGLLRYRWAPGQVYELMPAERDELLAMGWWTPVEEKGER